MKRGTLAKRLGFALLRHYRIPYLNHKNNTVHDKKLNCIRTKYLTSWNDFTRYFDVHVKRTAPHAKELTRALAASSSVEYLKSTSAIISGSNSTNENGTAAPSTSSDEDPNNQDRF